jgi:hypothetical protein
VHNLSKRFGYRVAFHDVSFEIGYGQVFGFVGPNGAGKTTTLRTLATLIAPTSGSAIVAGIPLAPENGVEIRRRIAVMPEWGFEPGQEHWHGAAPNRFMTHLSLVPVDDQGQSATWAPRSLTRRTAPRPLSPARTGSRASCHLRAQVSDAWGVPALWQASAGSSLIGIRGDGSRNRTD